MKNVVFLAIFCFLALPLAFGARGLSKYPESQDPSEFAKEVEALIVSSYEYETKIISNERESLKTWIKEDERDWEAALTPIVGSPEKYGPQVASIALSVAAHRGKFSQHPKLVESAVRLFRYEKSRAIKRQDDDRSAGIDRGAGKTIMGGTIASFLRRVRLPETLQEVLIYFSSGEDAKFNLMDSYVSNEVAESLRTYGDERHIGEARKFSIKLRSAGKSDIADDIDRSVERIEKDQARSAAGAERKGADRDAGKAGEEDAKAEANSASRSWIVAGLATLVALGAGVLFLKRKG